MEPFADDCHQKITANGDPNLRFDGILRGSIKGFDPQMLLDPFEEQFNVPAAAVQFTLDSPAGAGQVPRTRRTGDTA